jgi:MFS transporter, SET family, sugar efflux transporter
MTDTTGTTPRLPVTAFIAASLFFTGVTYAATLPYAGIVAIDALHISNIDYAWILVAGSLVSALAAVSLGHISDKVRDRRLIIIATALLGALGNGLIYAVRDPLAYIVAFCVIMPFGGALFSQTFSFARVHYDTHQPDRATFMVTMLRTVFVVAWVVIPPIAGWIAAATSVFEVFALAMAAYLVCAAIFFVLPRREPYAPDLSQPAAQPARSIETSMLIGIGGVVLVNVAVRLNGTAAPLAIVANFGGTLPDVGFYAALAAFLEVPCMIAWGYAARRFRKHTLIVVGTLIFGLYLILLTQARTVSDVLWLQGFNAVSTAALMSIPISYMQDAIKGRVGLSTSLLDVTYVISGLLSAALFAITTTEGDYVGAFGAGAALCVAGAAILFLGHAIFDRQVARA